MNKQIRNLQDDWNIDEFHRATLMGDVQWSSSMRTPKIRNIDRIRQMSVEELVPLLICERNDGWISPSGNTYQCKLDCIEDCINWLNSEYRK